MSDYTQIWSDIGPHPQAHEEWLTVSGNMYDEIYLSQVNRPDSVEYFDSVMSEVNILSLLQHIWRFIISYEPPARLGRKSRFV